MNDDEVLELVLGKLDGVRSQPGGEHMARCPAHDDGNASLSVGRGTEQPVVLHCHAGCDTADVLAAIDLATTDISSARSSDDRRPGGEWMPGNRRAVAVYDYTDEQGKLLFQVLRSLDKHFVQRHPDPAARSGWAWNMKGVTRVPYRLPRVRKAARGPVAGRRVYIAEGEKDVHALEAAGVVATCNPMGAGKWRPEFGKYLDGIREAVIVADRDEAGRAHALQVAEHIRKHVLSVSVVEAAEGKDAADHFAAGHGLDGFVPADLSAPSAGSEQAADNEDDPVAARLAQLRTALLNSDSLGTVGSPQPVIDGLLYRDGLAWLYGKPGTYKSVIALDWACCVSVGLPWHYHETIQGPVLYVYIEGVSGLKQRVRAWEDRAGCKTSVAFLPIAVQLMRPVDLAALKKLIGDLRPVLVVLDTQARVTVGLEENSAMEMGKVVDAAGALAQVCGSCILLLHHEGRSGENMRGSIALEGAATSLFRAEWDGERVKLVNNRQRDTVEADDLLLYPVERLDSVILATDRKLPNTGGKLGVRRAPWEVLRTALSENFVGISASPSQLIATTGIPRTTVYRELSAQVKAGELVNTGTKARPRYELPKANFPQLPTDLAGPNFPIPTPGGSFRTPGGGNFGARPAEDWPEGSIGETASA